MGKKLDVESAMAFFLVGLDREEITGGHKHSQDHPVIKVLVPVKRTDRVYQNSEKSAFDPFIVA